MAKRNKDGGEARRDPPAKPEQRMRLAVRGIFSRLAERKLAEEAGVSLDEPEVRPPGPVP